MVSNVAHFIRSTCFVIAVAVIGFHCASTRALSTPQASLSCLPAEVRSAWQRHRDILVRILQGKRFQTTEYAAAVGFFETVTGLHAHDDGSDVGRIPTGRLESDLMAWDQWVAVNAGCLRWNSARQSVECVGTPSGAAPDRGNRSLSQHDV